MAELVTQFEWLADQKWVNFPFVDDALDADGHSLVDVVVDAYVVMHHAFAYLAAKSMVPDDAGKWQLEFVDDTGAVFTVNDAFQEVRGPWTIITGENQECSARILLLSEAASAISWKAGDISNGRLVPHAVGSTPDIVTSITVGGVTLVGDVTLWAGYNVNLAAAESAVDTAGRKRTVLTLAAISGAGEGAAPCTKLGCKNQIQSINHIYSNAKGDFVLTGDDCYTVLPNLQEGTQGLLTVPGTLFIGNNCSPCCDCSDYAQVYDNVLRPVAEEVTELAQEYNDLRSRYLRTYDKYLQAVACLTVPTIEMKLTGMVARTGTVAIGLHNNSNSVWPETYQPLSVVITPIPKLVNGSVELYDHPDGTLIQSMYDQTTGVMQFQIPPIPCCTTVWISFQLVWDGSGGFVTYQVSSSGVLDGVAYDLSGTESTLMPVNRGRT